MTERASIALSRADDGTLAGQITIGVRTWVVTNWRQGGDKLHILFDAKEADNAEVLRLMRELGG